MQLERHRLRGLGTSAEALIVRNVGLATYLDSLAVPYEILADTKPQDESAQSQSAIDAVMAEYGVATRQRTIACVATLDHDAGLPAMINAFGELVDNDKADQLLLVGTGPELNRLLRLAEAAGVGDRVQFLGLLPLRRWSSLMAGLLLIVFPRLRPETLGSSVPLYFLHALFGTCKILASRSAWDGQYGWRNDSENCLTTPEEISIKLSQQLALKRSATIRDSDKFGQYLRYDMLATRQADPAIVHI